MRFIYGVMILLCVFSSSLAMATMYRWINADGQVVYSQKKPINDVPVEKIAPPPPAASHSGGVTTTWQERKDENEKKQQKQQQEKDDFANKQAEIKQREKNCKVARANYTFYKSTTSSHINNGQGERTKLTDKLRKSNVRQSKQQIHQYCP